MILTPESGRGICVAPFSNACAGIRHPCLVIFGKMGSGPRFRSTLLEI